MCLFGERDANAIADLDRFAVDDDRYVSIVLDLERLGGSDDDPRGRSRKPDWKQDRTVSSVVTIEG